MTLFLSHRQQTYVRTGTHDFPHMFNKKLLFIIFTLNVVFFSAALIRDWNRRLWHLDTAFIGRDATPVTSTRLGNSLQAAKLSKERRIAASRAHVESVSIILPVTALETCASIVPTEIDSFELTVYATCADRSLQVIEWFCLCTER